MNQVNRVLDKFEAVPRRFRNGKRRQELLQRAILASSRGIKVLIEEQFTNDLGFSDDDVYRSAETMRQDRALLRAFVEAECRLLRDLGVSPSAVKRMRASLESVLLTLDSKPDPDVAAQHLDELLDSLSHDMSVLADEIDDDQLKRRLVVA